MAERIRNFHPRGLLRALPSVPGENRPMRQIKASVQAVDSTCRITSNPTGRGLAPLKYWSYFSMHQIPEEVKLLRDLGNACSEYQNRALRNLTRKLIKKARKT